MGDSDTSTRIEQMTKLILQEANDKAQQIESDAQQRKQTEMNKLYQKERDKAYEEFQKKQEQEDAKAGTMKSKMINESRLKIQESRFDLMKTIKQESIQKLQKFVSNRNVYKNLLKQLIVQG